MPGFDWLSSGLGDAFSGGDGGVDWGNLSTDFLSQGGGGFDWGSLGGLGADAFSGANWGNLSTDFINNGTGGGFDFSGGGLNFSPDVGNSLTTTPGAGVSPGGAANPFQFSPSTAAAAARVLGWGGGGGSTQPQQQQQQPQQQQPQTQGPHSSVPATGGGNPLTNILGNGGGVLGSGINLPQLLAAGGGIAGLFSNNGLGPAADKLNAQAKSQSDLVNNSILPTALANQQGHINGEAMGGINRQLQKSEAAMRQRYAEMGASGSTMEAEDLAGLRANAQDQMFQQSQAMAATGLQEAASLSGQDSQIYQGLMDAQVAQDAALQQAIARVAAAFAGTSAGAGGSGGGGGGGAGGGGGGVPQTPQTAPDNGLGLAPGQIANGIGSLLQNPMTNAILDPSNYAGTISTPFSEPGIFSGIGNGVDWSQLNTEFLGEGADY